MGRSISQCLMMFKRAHLFVSKEKVKVFERLAEEEWFHHVLGSQVKRVSHISDCRVPMLHFGVLLDALENVPAPLLVLFITCHVIKIPQTLNSLRSEKVVGVGRFGVEIIAPSPGGCLTVKGKGIEMILIVWSLKGAFLKDHRNFLRFLWSVFTMAIEFNGNDVKLGQTKLGTSY